MFWTIDLMYAIVAASLTGTVVTVLWFWIGKLLERLGFLHILYDLLRTVVIFWLVPAAWLLEWYRIVIKRRQGAAVFMPSGVILKVAYVFCVLWVIGVVVGLIRYLLQLGRNRRRVKAATECERPIRELFAKACVDYGISMKRVRLLQSYGEDTPKVVGVLHPAVLLPVKRYSQNDLQIIFDHELMHIKKRDLLTKNLGLILCVLHFWNPAAYWYVRLLDKWSEFACDYHVCVKRRNIKEYYGTIVAMAEENGMAGLFSQLAENKSRLRERMEHVVKCYKREKNKRTRTAAVLIVGCMVLGSAGTVHAATRSGARAMAVWAKKTEVVVPYQGPPVLEEYAAEPLFDTLVVEGEMKQQTQAAKGMEYFFNCEISGGSICQYPYLSKKQGETIKVSVSTDPEHVTMRVGIIRPDGNRVFVTGSDSIIYKFTLTQTGFCRVYVENLNSENVMVNGNYWK